MALSSSECYAAAETPNFQRRIRYCLVKTAMAVLAESINTAGHADRVVYAKKIIGGGYDVIAAGLAVLTDTNLKASGNLSNQDTFGLNDTEVQTAVDLQFSALAGVESGT